MEKYQKIQLRNKEIVTPLGTFSEAVREKQRQRKIFYLIKILCILLIWITGGLCWLFLR